MAIKIIKPGDQPAVKSLFCVLYGAPGIGKTSLALSSEKPLLLDFDGGFYRATRECDRVEIESWQDAKKIEMPDVAAHKTVIIDTAGRCLDEIRRHLFRENPDLRMSNGEPTRGGYGAIKGEFIEWLDDIRRFSRDVVVTAHMSEQNQNDKIVRRIDVVGGSKDEIYKCADLIGFVNFNSVGELTINFSPTALSFGKNPANLPEMIIPKNDDQFLAKILAKSRKVMIERLRSSKPPKANAELAKILEAKGLAAEQLDLAKGLAKTADEKKRVLKVATDNGYGFDKESGRFVAAA